MEREFKVSLEGKPDASVRAVKIGSFALFLTVVITTAVLSACVITAICLLRQGDTDQCPTCPAAQTASKMMTSNMDMEKMYKMEDGSMMKERFKYDLDTNTVLINSPANFSGISDASDIVLDYDRSLMFMKVHDENRCMALPWPADIAQKLEEFMINDDENREVIEAVSMEVERRSYVPVGKIPAGYLQSSNGMTVGALCSGRDTHWLDLAAEAPRVRRWRSPTIRVCVGFVCFDITVHG